MSKSTTSTNLARFFATYPWRSALLMVFIVLTFAFNVAWVWGVFWIWWALASAKSGEFVFLDIVNKSKQPVLFWLMVICWLLVGASYFVNEFFPTYFEY